MKTATRLLAALLLCAAGCRAVSAPPQPVPPGAYSAADAEINEALQAAHAAVAQAEADVALGKFAPSPGYKAALNAIVSTLNQADPAYKAYHAALASNPSAAEPPELSSVALTLETELASLSSLRN